MIIFTYSSFWDRSQHCTRAA